MTDRKEYMRNLMRKRRQTKFPRSLNCSCCGADLEKMARYCDNCKKLYFNIYHREYGQAKRKTERTKRIDKDNRAMHEVNESDMMFKNDLCDNDCANCKYPDCILPTE